MTLLFTQATPSDVALVVALRAAVAEAVRRMDAIYSATKRHPAVDDVRELPGGLFT